MIFVFLLLILLFGVGLGALFITLYSILKDSNFFTSLNMVLLEVTVPKDISEEEKQKQGSIPEQIAQGALFLSSLSSLKETNFLKSIVFGKPIWSFEIVAHPNGEIVFFVAAPRDYESFLEKQILAYYPKADVRRVQDYTLFEAGDTVTGGFVKQERKKYLPIKTYEELTADPLQGITQALSKMEKGDGAAVQMILRTASGKTRRKGRAMARKVSLGKETSVRSQKPMMEKAFKYMKTKKKDEGGGSGKGDDAWLPQMSPVEQEHLEKVDKKANEYQFEITMRIAVSCKTKQAAETQYNSIKGALASFNEPTLNQLKVKRSTSKKFYRDFIFRTFDSRNKMVLSQSEVLSLYHFPLPSTETPNIRFRKARRAAAPAKLPQSGVLLGYNEFRGAKTPIYLQKDDRRRHVYSIGQTGTGKSTLFKNMALQDIENGDGVAVIDPHGELVKDLLPHIPRWRAEDVIIFDPRDTERPLGLNMLEAKDISQRDLVVQEIVGIIEKLATRLNPEAVGPMFEHYLRNALLTLIEDPEATLVDVPRLFTDQNFRKWIVDKVENPIVKQFWEQEYAQSQKGQQAADMLSYVISKLGRFISNDIIRNIIGQSQSSFDVRKIMDQKKILLVNLSKGAIGDINADLLGFVLVSKLQIAALGRTDIPEEQRNDFYLYLDEFQNFTTDTVGTILSEARKYRLDLNLTHQFIAQLSDPIREAVFGNVGTVISYRIGVDDTELMGKQFAPVFDEYDLLNIERAQAYIRLLYQNEPQRPFSLSPLPPPKGGDPKLAELLTELSRLKYGRPRTEVEEKVRERLLAAGSAGSSRDIPSIFP